MRTKRKVTAALATVALAGGLAAGCSTASQTPTPPSTTTTPTGPPVTQTPKQTPPPATTPPAPKQTPLPATTPPAPEKPALPATEGPIGTTFTVPPDQGSDGGFLIRLEQVKCAVKVGEMDMASVDPGTQLVGLRFWAKSTGKHALLAPVTDLKVLGSNGEGYDMSADQVAALKDLNVELTWKGEHTDGWLFTQIPKGVTVTSVAWTPMSMLDTTLTWNIAK